MSTAMSIARREFSTYFNSPVAYVVLGVYLIAAGSLFFFIMGGGLFTVGLASMRSFFGIAPWLFMVVAPAVTMRLIAEERKTGTFEVLMSLPVREGDVVAGKFLGAVAMIAVGLLFTLPFPISVSLLTPATIPFDWGPVIGGYLGVLLMTSTFIAVGMWTSAITKNQIESFIMGLAICFLLIIIDNVALIVPGAIGAVFQYLSVSFHFENIARGVIDTRDIVYYLTMTGVGLKLTSSALTAVRQ
jgi:ABC-2 type transport system permease protein